MNPIFFNLSKRKKRDILSDLLEGKPTEGIISKKELNAVNRLLEGRTSNNTPVKINNRPAKTKKFTAAGKKSLKTKIVTSAGKVTQQPKKKKPHYLSHEIYEKLTRHK